jgi:hypothetical protein
MAAFLLGERQDVASRWPPHPPPDPRLVEPRPPLVRCVQEVLLLACWDHVGPVQDPLFRDGEVESSRGGGGGKLHSLGKLPHVTLCPLPPPPSPVALHLRSPGDDLFACSIVRMGESIAAGDVVALSEWEFVTGKMMGDFLCLRIAVRPVTHDAGAGAGQLRGPRRL